MDNKEVENCWDFWKCCEDSKKTCQAFALESGKECWLVAGSYNKTPSCPKSMNGYKMCTECKWFTKLNPSGA